jgi:hypothetical protein
MLFEELAWHDITSGVGLIRNIFPDTISDQD